MIVGGSGIYGDYGEVSGEGETRYVGGVKYEYKGYDKPKKAKQASVKLVKVLADQPKNKKVVLEDIKENENV